MSSFRIGSDGKEEGEIGATDCHEELPVVRTAVQAEGPNESNMPSEGVSQEAIPSGHVHRADWTPKQAKPRGRGNLPIGGLCLKRKVGESILIKTSDGDIVVSLIEIANKKAKIAFNAPVSIKVYREELLPKGASA